MEKWDLYDKHRNKIGKQITRGDDMTPDEFHLVIHVCVFNSKGEMLIQQRQPPLSKVGRIFGISLVVEVLLQAIQVAGCFKRVIRRVGYSL